MKTYKYVDGEYEIKTEIKRSVFIASVKGEVDKEGAEEFVRRVRKKYADATHNCYAYICDELGNATRFSDDGEPSGTAGQPILDVIRKQGIVRSVIVVTRYFGGIKLGAGGLVGAYSGCASDALLSAKISQKVECERVVVRADYSTFALIEKHIRNAKCALENIEYDNDVCATIYIPLDSVDALTSQLQEASCGKADIAKTAFYQYKNID